MLLETQWNGMVSNRYEMQQPPFLFIGAEI